MATWYGSQQTPNTDIIVIIISTTCQTQTPSVHNRSSCKSTQRLQRKKTTEAVMKRERNNSSAPGYGQLAPRQSGPGEGCELAQRSPGQGPADQGLSHHWAYGIGLIVTGARRTHLFAEFVFKTKSRQGQFSGSLSWPDRPHDKAVGDVTAHVMTPRWRHVGGAMTTSQGCRWVPWRAAVRKRERQRRRCSRRDGGCARLFDWVPLVTE